VTRRRPRHPFRRAGLPPVLRSGSVKLVQ
jgi:hypothetical protein